MVGLPFTNFPYLVASKGMQCLCHSLLRIGIIRRDMTIALANVESKFDFVA